MLTTSLRVCQEEWRLSLRPPSSGSHEEGIVAMVKPYGMEIEAESVSEAGIRATRKKSYMLSPSHLQSKE